MNACPSCHAVNAEGATECGACQRSLPPTPPVPSPGGPVRAVEVGLYVVGGLVVLDTLFFVMGPGVLLWFLPPLMLLILLGSGGAGALIAYAGYAIKQGKLAAWVPMVALFGLMTAGSILGVLRNDPVSLVTMLVGAAMLVMLLMPETRAHVGAGPRDVGEAGES